MKQIVFCLAMLLVSAMVHAKELVVTVNAKEVKLNSTAINHEIKETDKNKGSQASPMACSFLLYGLLAKNDIQEAAKISTDPAKAVDKWTNYRERVGVEFFKKTMDEYFTSKNVILAEIVLGEDIMLVIKTEDGKIAQFYQKKDGKYVATDNPASAKTFGEVLNMIRADKIKL